MSCAGKSTLISGLKNGDLPELAEALAMDRSQVEYESFRAKEWQLLAQASRAGVLFHFEITRRQFALQGGRDSALGVIERARRVSFLTLWERPEEIERRFSAKMRERRERRLRLGRPDKTYRGYRRGPVIAQRDRMWRLYCQWFDYSRRFDGSPHWVLRSSAPDELVEVTPGMQRTPFWEVAK